MTRNDSTIDRSVDRTSRRNFLITAGAVGTAAGVGGIAAAQDSGDEPDETFRLTADQDYWIGNEPASIRGEKNPTLELEAGNTYRVVWENGDGESHNFAIYSHQGNLLVHSPFLDNKGATQTVEFTATEGMIDYYCEVHYLSMRGDVQVSGETGEVPEPVSAGYFSDGPSVALETVADGFSYPVDFAVADEAADRRFIADQTGQIYVHDDGLQDEPFLDISDRLVQEKGPHPEVGLLGLAFHPDFEANGRFFVRYSAPIREGTPREYDHTEMLSEFQATDDLSRGDPDSEQVLIEFPSPQSNHNSGNVLFGPDDFLYVTMGEGGFGGDHAGLPGHVTGGNGQDVTQNLLGGVHRIDVDNEDDDKPYAIPDDNPLVDDEDGLDEYYAWGFRNPWGTSFDSQGRLFVADVMRSLYEEVNLVEKGGNYGWNLKEGTNCFDPWHHGNPPEECADTGYPPRNDELIDPIIEYPHIYQDNPVGQAVTGGHVYEGDEVSELQGEYVFGDWSFSPIQPHGTLLSASPPGNDDDVEDEGSSHGSHAIQADTIRLGGEVQAWRGEKPSDIEGQQNPTLTLVAGQTYEVTWENLDGEPHNFVIETDNGEHLVETEIIDGEGETQTVEFEATEEIAEYYCGVHPDTMRGSIEIEEDHEDDVEDEAEDDVEEEEEGAVEEEEEGAVEEEDKKEDDAVEEEDEDEDGRWVVDKLPVDGDDARPDGRVNRFIIAFGEDNDGELYVLTSETFLREENEGAVHKLVSAEGE